MPMLAAIAEVAPLLDVLALAACLMMLCFLMLNRLKYGRLYLGHPEAAGKGDFAREVAMQLMSQQSRKAYDNLQRALAREFASLGTADGGCLTVPATGPDDERHAHPAVGGTGAERRHCYGRAKAMLGQGADAETILRQCGLAESELELLQGLQQLAAEDPSER